MVENAMMIATPKQEIGLLLQQANQILLLKQRFKHGVHFGPPYPGSTKDTLLKPGAELLARRFGIYPHYEVMKEIVQINTSNLAESVILYIYRCEMRDVQTGAVVGEAIGACSSLEDKYRWRNDKLKCPNCNKDVLMKSKRDANKWWCNKYREGCGEEFSLDDPQIANQQVGKIINPNPFNELNTIIKMAQKRGMVSSVIGATGAGAYFAPGDLEVTDIYATDDNDGDLMESELDVPDVDEAASFPTESPSIITVGEKAESPKQAATDKPRTADWTAVWAEFKRQGWTMGNKDHIHTVFPNGVDNLSPETAIKMITPKSAPVYGKTTAAQTQT